MYVGRSALAPVESRVPRSGERPRALARVRAVAEADYMRRTRDGYDLTAGAYAERFHHHLRDKPLDRAVIGGFVWDW